MANTGLRGGGNNTLNCQEEEGKQLENKGREHDSIKSLNLYVQLPNETMSELVRDYMAHFFDKTKFVKKNQGENIDELNLTMNPTSLLEKDMATKQKRLQ